MQINLILRHPDRLSKEVPPTSVRKGVLSMCHIYLGGNFLQERLRGGVTIYDLSLMTYSNLVIEIVRNSEKASFTRNILWNYRSIDKNLQLRGDIYDLSLMSYLNLVSPKFTKSIAMSFARKNLWNYRSLHRICKKNSMGAFFFRR